jgi:phytoene dehydrogenase-like protein
VGSSYDAIIVGGGHNGLLLGAYLAKSGMSVVVFEKQYEVGGGLCTMEFTRSGFLHNMHSNFISGHMHAPALKDLALENYGLQYIYPEITHGLPFSDGKCALVYTDDNKTYKNFARFSRKDAETYLSIKKKIRRVEKDLFNILCYTPPHELAEDPYVALPKKMEQTLDFFNPSWVGITSAEAIDEIFEDEHIRMLYHFIAAQWAENDIKGLAAMLPTHFMFDNETGLIKGGSHQLAHATGAVICSHGGDVYEGKEVEKILVKKGKAVGVRLDDGKEVEAKKLVASNLNPNLTFLDLIGEEYLESDIVKKIKNYIYKKNVLMGIHFACHEPPRYTSANWDSDMNRAWALDIGFETLSDLMTMWRDLREGNIPKKLGFNAFCNTLFDPTQAPPGKHTIGIWVNVPSPRHIKGGIKIFEEKRDEIVEECIQRWKEYAPNINEENIIETGVYSPVDMEIRNPSFVGGDWCVGDYIPEQSGWNRPFPEAGKYKTSIEGLYLCGPCTHSGGGILQSCGYLAFRVIAEDFKIIKWWI